MTNQLTLLQPGQLAVGPFGYNVDVATRSTELSCAVLDRRGDNNDTDGVFSSWTRAAVSAWAAAVGPLAFRSGVQQLVHVGRFRIRLIGLHPDQQSLASAFLASVLGAPGSVVPRALDDAIVSLRGGIPFGAPEDISRAIAAAIYGLGPCAAVNRFEARSRTTMTDAVASWADAYAETTGINVMRSQRTSARSVH